MVSEKFRRQLRQEAESWRTDGLIGASQYDQLAQRYQFSTLDTDSRDRFVVILLGLGGLLLGLGVITFVAANWQVWSRSLKMVLLLSLFLSVNGAGFYLWSSPSASPDARLQTWRQRLGHGLLLLGAFILGANIALMGQLFHQSGSASSLFLAWGLGVLAMAYALRLVSLGFLAIVLMGIGYWLGIWDMARTGILTQWFWLMQGMPLVAGGLFIPLAYRCRSRVLFGLGAIAVVTSLTVVLADLMVLFQGISGIVLAIGIILLPALLWGYDDFRWQRRSQRPVSLGRTLSFQVVAQNLAVAVLAVLFYQLSFHWAWPEPVDALALPSQVLTLMTASWPPLMWISLLFAIAWTVTEWVSLGWSDRGQRRFWRLDQTSSVILLFLLIAAFVAFWHWQVAPVQPLATFIFNLLLALVAVGLIREGLGNGQRRVFWSGMLLLVLQIVTRMLEYNTSLLFKALVFALCGVGVILIGLWFERYVRAFSPPTRPALPTGEVES